VRVTSVCPSKNSSGAATPTDSAQDRICTGLGNVNVSAATTTATNSSPATSKRTRDAVMILLPVAFKVVRDFLIKMNYG
jgi:hypothetical protein